jgi:hypothetical protein
VDGDENEAKQQANNRAGRHERHLDSFIFDSFVYGKFRDFR